MGRHLQEASAQGLILSYIDCRETSVTLAQRARPRRILQSVARKALRARLRAVIGTRPVRRDGPGRARAARPDHLVAKPLRAVAWLVMASKLTAASPSLTVRSQSGVQASRLAVDAPLDRDDRLVGGSHDDLLLAQHLALRIENDHVRRAIGLAGDHGDAGFLHRDVGDRGVSDHHRRHPAGMRMILAWSSTTWSSARAGWAAKPAGIARIAAAASIAPRAGCSIARVTLAILSMLGQERQARRLTENGQRMPNARSSPAPGRRGTDAARRLVCSPSATQLRIRVCINSITNY